MAINFPNLPTVNQIFNPTQGVAYQWDGVKWRLMPQGYGSIWEPIYDGVQTSILSWQAINLGAYSDLLLRIVLRPDVTAGYLILQISEDNGTTWIAGTNYAWQSSYSGTNATSTAAAFGGSAVANIDLSLGGTIAATTNTPGIKYQVDVSNFNKAQPTALDIAGGFQHQTLGALLSVKQYGMCARSIAANGIKLTLQNAASGYVTLLGKRG